MSEVGMRAAGGDDEMLASTADAIESLAEGGAAFGMPPAALVIAAALFAEFDGDSSKLSAVALRLRAGISLLAEAVPAAGVCTTGCPPDEPAAYRKYLDDDGNVVRICDHVPIHPPQ